MHMNSVALAAALALGATLPGRAEVLVGVGGGAMVDLNGGIYYHQPGSGAVVPIDVERQNTRTQNRATEAPEPTVSFSPISYEYPKTASGSASGPASGCLTDGKEHFIIRYQISETLDAIETAFSCSKFIRVVAHGDREWPNNYPLSIR